KHREALLDTFEKSPLSGTKFAALHGVKYQTFATWVQNRKRERDEYPVVPGDEPPAQKLLESLVELELPATACMRETTPSTGCLLVEHPSGIRMTVADESQAELAATLLNKLNPVPSC
ncbi:hypothetical protein SAMN02745181_0018, partial [Rubritalea squalenifaciens DSM 18772]